MRKLPPKLATNIQTIEIFSYALNWEKNWQTDILALHKLRLQTVENNAKQN